MHFTSEGPAKQFSMLCRQLEVFKMRVGQPEVLLRQSTSTCTFRYLMTECENARNSAKVETTHMRTNTASSEACAGVVLLSLRPSQSLLRVRGRRGDTDFHVDRPRAYQHHHVLPGITVIFSSLSSSRSESIFFFQDVVLFWRIVSSFISPAAYEYYPPPPPVPSSVKQAVCLACLHLCPHSKIYVSLSLYHLSARSC
jgi:hypothetical protein